MAVRVIAYRWPSRIAAATLVVISRASLPILLALVIFSNDPPILPFVW